MPLSLQRLARNQVIFREANERLRDPAEKLPGGTAAYVCECSDVGCPARIELTLLQYQAVRARPKSFFVVPGHERLEVERVVDHADGYTIVEKVVALDDAATRALSSTGEGWSAHDF